MYRDKVYKKKDALSGTYLKSDKIIDNLTVDARYMDKHIFIYM